MVTLMSTSPLPFPFPVVGTGGTSRPAPRPPLVAAAPTFLVHPPYLRLECHASLESLQKHHLKPGSIAGIRLEPGTEWLHIEPAIRQLRTHLPASPLILVVPGASGRDLLLSTRAARGGVRAVLNDDEPLRDSLQAALTCRDGLADDVVEWLSLRRLRLSPTVSSLLREIFAHAATEPDLSSLLARVGLAESSARFRLHKRLLPTPSRWFQAARALHTALRVQASPELPLLRIAHEFGYADHSALSQLIFRAFRLRPGAIRGTLGWEWLMHRWVAALPEAARRSRV